MGGHRGLWVFLGEKIGTNAIKEAFPLLIWGLSNPQPPHVRYRGNKNTAVLVENIQRQTEMEGSTTEGHVVGIPVSNRAYAIEEPDLNYDIEEPVPEFPVEETPNHGGFSSSFQSSYGESRTCSFFICSISVHCEPRKTHVLTKLLLSFSFGC